MKSKLLIILLCFGCDTSLPLQNKLPTYDDFVIQADTLIVDIEEEEEIEYSYQLGRDIYKFSCAVCHLSPDGRDIIRFGRSNPIEQADSIISRALGHVSLDSAKQVEFYLSQLQEELGITPNDNAPVIPTPVGDIPWNGSPLTLDIIENWDFMQIGTSFEFPRWFNNETNTDWIPEDTIHFFDRGEIRAKYHQYINDPSDDNLIGLMVHAEEIIEEGEVHPGDHGFYDFEKAFESQRWLSVLYMQHILSNQDPTTPILVQMAEFGQEVESSRFSLLDPLWRVGNVARRSGPGGNWQSPDDELDNRAYLEASWMYLSWLPNLGRRNTFEGEYLATALSNIGDKDLASMVILKSIINRSPNSRDLFMDVRVLTKWNLYPAEKYYSALEFGLNYLETRLIEDYDNTTSSDGNDPEKFKEAFEGIAVDDINSSHLTSDQKEILIEKLLSVASLL